MNDDHLSSSHKYSQSQVDFRQPYLINCYTEQEQSEENRAINNNTNRAELDWLRTLYDSLPCIYFTLNSAGVILTVSQFGATYLGYGALELTQTSIERVFFQDDRVHGEAMLMHLQQQPAQMSQWEARIIHKNGTPIWVKATAHLVPGTEFNPIISLVCEDITAHKQRSEALEESEERFRSIADSAPMLLWMSDADGLCTFFNQSWLNFTGRALEQEQGDGWTQGVHPEDLHDCLTTYLSALKARHDFRMEYRLQQASGEYRWVLNTGIPRFTPNGSFVGYIGSCVDITDRKQAEEALRQQFLRERLIGAIAQRIHQSLNLEEILNTTVAEVRQLLACDRVVIFRLHKDGSGVVVVESVSSGWKHIAGTTINDRYFAEAYIQLYKYGRVQAVEDIYTAGLTQCHVDLLARFQVRANLVVPIVHEEQLWGLLVAQQCSEPRRWQEWEIELLKSLATQAAIAIHQSELYQQAQTEIVQRQQAEVALQQQIQRERVIRATLSRIRQSLNLEEILNATVAEVRQVLQTDRVIVFRFEPDWSGNVVVESVDSRWAAILGTNVYDPCFEEEYVLPYQEGRVKAIEDIYTENLSLCHLELLARFQVRANLVVPIVQSEQTLQNPTSETNNRLWGLLIAHQCSESRRWQQFEIDLLCSLASQVAIALHQSQLYEQAQYQAKRERALNQVTQAIRRSLDLKTIFSTAVREIGELLQVERVEIVQYLPERKLWLHVSEYRKSNNLPVSLGKEIPDDNNPLAEKLRRLEIIEIQDTEALDDQTNKSLAQTGPGSWLLVPLHFGSHILGSLTLERYTRPYQWQDSEVELIRAVADQVAIAIHQSQLYEQAQYQAKREQALNQLTQAIRRSLDLPTIFSTATCEIEKLLQVDRVCISQYLPEQNLWTIVAESCKNACSTQGLGLAIPDSNNPLAERIKRLEVVRIEDTHAFEDDTNKSVAQLFPGAWLLAPLHFGSSLWGALVLVMERSPYYWQDTQVEILCEVADQLAIALQQAELYQQSRTATATALQQAQKLEQTVEELQKTQAQLVQSEKMSSLGQLVAGVAHEINNPVSFIYGNLMHADGYTQDLLGLIKLYQQQYSNPTADIQEEIEAIDLDFLVEDLPKLLDSMRVGAERICEIVGALRNFSRLAEAEMKAVDIHEGLDSTLLILQNRLRAQGQHPEINVIKEYGNLPKVECYAGQLNQVFMNLLTNAIDALEELNVGTLKVESSQELNVGTLKVENSNQPSNLQRPTPCIWIKTEVVSDRKIAIRIADNGPGISEQVKARLFDPFFTTKPVGTGTGLGLSISYQIVVEKHGGQLHCFSQVGQGTEFVIQIPIWQPETLS